jgi:cytochrome c
MVRRSLVVAGAAVLVVAGAPFQVTVAAQAAPDGATLYKQRCQACHQITAGKAMPTGPNLYGVVGRKAAAAPVPFNYSAALKKSGLTWTRANLDKYLSAPTNMVPGTKMIIAIPNAAQRSAIIDHLARTK